jgi:peptide/nickel transport system permease protein
MRKLTSISLGWIFRVISTYIKSPTQVAAAIFVTVVCLIGIGADFFASEMPIACKIDNKTYIFPSLFKPAELADMDNQSIILKIKKEGGWALVPPIPYGPNQIKINGTINWLNPPDKQHLLGTDDWGRDVLARIIHGCRSALFVGAGSMLICTFLGMFLGALAAYFGGLLDKISIIFIETLTAFPTFFLILGIQGLFGITTLWQLVIIIGATRWTDVARVTRAEVLRTVNEEYVDAARALGLSHLKILSRHVLPAVMGPVLVSSTFGVAGAILIENTLSFLGYGAPPPTASWGQLMADAFNTHGAYWLMIFPGLMLFMSVLSINIVGEGLSDSAQH